MAGHSKWKNIQHRKSKQDAKRGQLFTKISKEIYVAVRNGGDDPNTNGALRQALQKARQNNMPASNIENTIKKAMGNVEGVQYEEVLYEGYGPGGVAVLVEVLTDNRNRTAAEIRHIFSRHGGNLGESGCVAFLFERKGLIQLSISKNGKDEDSIYLDALEAGAEDVEVEDDLVEIIVAPEQFEETRQALEEQGYKFEQAEITRIPSTTISLTGDDASTMMKLVDMLEDNDDVQNVHANFELDEAEWA